MTTELVLLLGIFAFVILGVFISGPAAPENVFAQGGPHLGARIEKQLSTGRYFLPKPGGLANSYEVPPTAPPNTGF